MKPIKTLLALAACLSLVAALPAAAAEQNEGKQEPAMQKTCPIMGGAINKDLYVDVEGKRVYVCCAACKAAVKKTPEKAIKTLKERGEPVADAPEEKGEAAAAMKGKAHKHAHRAHKAKHGKQMKEKKGGCCGTGTVGNPDKEMPAEAAKQPAAEKDGMKKQPAATPQATCPIMGGKINKNLFVDVEGKRVYVCCAGCKAAVKKNPEKALKTLAKRGEAVADAPKME